MRILHVVSTLGKGGLENGLVNLIHGLDPNAFEHVVCAIRELGPNADRLTNRAEVISLGTRSRTQTTQLVRVIRRVRPDIVHSRNWGAIESVVAARIGRAGASIHSEHGFEARDGANEPWRRSVGRRLAFEMADAVVAVSDQLRLTHARRTGFPASKIAVIRNGVDRRRFFPDIEKGARVRAALEVGDSELCIGCVANLLPVKDHLTLLRSLASPSMQRIDWRLILIGGGPEETALRAFAKAHLRADRVRFIGPTSDVPDMLRAMDIFVLPSLAEGMCNSLLEAMATGLPVVATAVGGNPELIEHERSGLLVPCADPATLATQLARLCADPRLRMTLGRAAVERVATAFSMESMIQGYRRLYDDVRHSAPGLAASTGNR